MGIFEINFRLLECGIVFQLAEVLSQDQQENIPGLPRLPVTVGSVLTGILANMALNCILTTYCAIATGFLTYILIRKSLQNECSLFPYINKDRHHMYDERTGWEDPRSQRNWCDTYYAQNFFNESAWKNDLKELLNEIHE